MPDYRNLSKKTIDFLYDETAGGDRDFWFERGGRTAGVLCGLTALCFGLAKRNYYMAGAGIVGIVWGAKPLFYESR